jgi:hypothetical protein
MSFARNVEVTFCAEGGKGARLGLGKLATRRILRD